MKYTPDTIARYKLSWHKNRLRKAKTNELRRKKALAEARRLAKVLASDYHIKKVIVFGSTNEPGKFSETSDIDLAVLGLKARDYFQALGQLIGESTFTIDLVDYESGGVLIKKRIDRGKVLYEK
jgi:predicted nucleotidyltransferase